MTHVCRRPIIQLQLMVTVIVELVLNLMKNMDIALISIIIAVLLLSYNTMNAVISVTMNKFYSQDLFISYEHAVMVTAISQAIMVWSST